MARKSFLLTLLFIFIICTNCFASDWNFENEKEVYKDLGNLIFYTNSDNTSLAKNFNLYTDTFTDNLFSALETKLEASSYSQSTYKFVVVKFESSTQIQFWITEQFVYPSTQLKTSYLRININFDGNYNITNTASIYKGSTTTAGNIKSSSTTPNAFYLSNSISTNIGIENESIPYYSLANRHGLNYSSNEIQKINKFATVEAVLLNKEYDVGLNYDVDVKYYYIDNNEKIYVTDKILNNTNNYWWGTTETPYIAVNDIQELPRGIYFADYIFTLKNTTYNNYSYSTTKEVFRIVESDTDDGETGGEITPSGDTGGGTTTPDYSEDLENIQIGITDINNNIGETNNKLDNISGELSNINNNLTTVPDISDTIITNDDITSNLDFEFEQDPYTNFWFELTTGLSNAFTNSKREISIQFRDKTHIISLDNFSVQLPPSLKPFLTIISTVFITWKMLQYIKIIIDNISSGNIDEVLEMNEEEGITNLF